MDINERPYRYVDLSSMTNGGSNKFLRSQSASALVEPGGALESTEREGVRLQIAKVYGIKNLLLTQPSQNL